MRLVPALVAALDLSESAHPELAVIGSTRLEELAREVEPDWRQRPPRRLPVRPIVPRATPVAGSKRSPIADELWDDLAEADAEQIVGLLFVAAEPLKRSEIAETLRISPGAAGAGVRGASGRSAARLAAAGHGDQLTPVSASACAINVERYLGKGPPEALRHR